MPYTLNKTDGTILTDLLDNSVDRTTTDLALVGKNTANYGELFNENFIKLLENFASDQEPRSPLKGQLWFDTSEDTLKIYTGNTFIEFAKPIVSSSEPNTTSAGDFWFNSNTRQLFFNDGNGLRLAGPIYTAQQGISGFEIATVADITGITHVIAKLKLGNILVGIFSDSAFTPNYSAGEGLKLASENVTGNIIKGFTPLSNLFKFNVTVARSESLVDAFGQPISVDEFVKVTGQNTIDGRLTITGTNTSSLSDLLNKPLSLGWGPNLTFEMEQPPSGATVTPPVRLRINRADQDITITTKKGTVFEDAVYVKADTSRVGIFTTSPGTTLDVNGNLTVRNNIIGTTTTSLLDVGTGTINFGGDATDIQIGSTTGFTTINNDTKVLAKLIINNPISLNPAVLQSNNTKFNLLNTNTTEINFGSVAGTINIGAANGTVTFNNDVVVTGNHKIEGIFNVDNIRIKDNQVNTTGDFDLELGALFPNRGIKLIDVTSAQEEFFIEKQLTFIGNTLRVDPSFTGPFNLLNTTVPTINIGGETLAINIGNSPSPNAKINALSRLQTYKDLIIGNSAGDPGEIKSSGINTNLFNNTRIINMAQEASDINIFGDGGAGSFGHRQPIRTMRINATSVVIEGDLELRGGDITATLPRAGIFSNAQLIEIGDNSTTIILGGPSTNVEIGNRLQVGSTGSVFLQSRTVGGKIRGGLLGSSNMDEFELIPEFVTNVYISPSSEELQLGQGLRSELYWRTPATAGGAGWSPNRFIPDGFDIIGGNPVQRYRTQYPVTISRNNHLIRGKLMMSDKSLYYPNAILFMNEWNEVVSVNNIQAFDTGSLTLGGSLTVSGIVSGPGATPAYFNNIRINQTAEFVGNLTSTTVASKNVFTSNVTTLNIGGTLNGVINLGGSTGTTNIPGKLKVGWKRITANYDAYAGDRLLVDTEIAGIELRLPPNVGNPTIPVVGDQIQIIDVWKFNVNVVELIRNGNKINGVDANVTLNQAGTAFTLVYTGTERGWCYDHKV